MAAEESILADCVSHVNATLARALGPDPAEPLNEDWKVWIGVCAIACGMVLLNLYPDARDIGKIVYLAGMDLLVLAIVPFSRWFSTLLILIITFDVAQYAVHFVSSVFKDQGEIAAGAGGVTTVTPMGPLSVPGVAVPVAPVHGPGGKRVWSFQADTIYTDFDRGCTRVWLVFIAQCIFLLGYLDSLVTIIKALPADGFGAVNYAYWLLAAIATQCGSMMASASESQLGAFWDYKKWSIIVRSALYHGEDACKRLNRCFMDFLVNGLGRQTVVLTVPVWMMMAESMLDLVKDSLAVAFITQLDDLTRSDKMYAVTIPDDGAYDEGETGSDTDTIPDDITYDAFGQDVHGYRA